MIDEYDISSPLPVDYFSQIFASLRLFKNVFKERFTLDHYMDGTIDTSIATADGYHRQVTMPQYLTTDLFDSPIYEPDAMSGTGILFIKKVNGISSLCFKNYTTTTVIR